MWSRRLDLCAAVFWGSKELGGDFGKRNAASVSQVCCARTRSGLEIELATHILSASKVMPTVGTVYGGL
jgi:hypothetical protein